MMAPTQIYVSNDVPYIMEIPKEGSCGKILEQTMDDCGIESTIVLSESNTLTEELDDHEENIEEVSSEIVTVLSDDNTDYSMLSTDENRQHFLTVEDLAGSSFENMPMLSITADASVEECGGWSEVAETLEVLDDVTVVEDPTPGHTIQEKSSIDPEPSHALHADDTPPATFCLLIDGQPYNIIPSHQIVVAHQVDESKEEAKLESKQGKLEADNSKCTNGKKLARKKRSHACFEPGCNRSYTSLHHLKVHMRKHEGLRPYACPVDGCGKAFAEMYSYSTHIRTHTGEKPYICTQCSKGFKTSGDLLKHTRTHTGERPFKCPVDGCDKAFTTADIRKIHIRSHTGEKPFICDIPGCERKFSSSTNCKNHMRIHTGEKPYVCRVEGCTSRFTEYSSLYKHRNVHKQKENSFLGGKSLRASSQFSCKATSRTRRNSVKKLVKNVKESCASFVSLQDEEPENMDNDTLNMTLDDDNFEIYQLILNDDLKM